MTNFHDFYSNRWHFAKLNWHNQNEERRIIYTTRMIIKDLVIVTHHFCIIFSLQCGHKMTDATCNRKGTRKTAGNFSRLKNMIKMNNLIIFLPLQCVCFYEGRLKSSIIYEYEHVANVITSGNPTILFIDLLLSYTNMEYFLIDIPID